MLVLHICNLQVLFVNVSVRIQFVHEEKEVKN